MPREVIHPSAPRNVEDDRVRLQATVGWTRDLEAQIGLQVEDAERTIVDMLYDDPAMLQALGTLMLGHNLDANADEAWDRVVAEEEGRRVLTALNKTRDYVERDGIWMTLDRRQINLLIRQLRRARDEAYGRDE